jgi:glycosyltransferase involved in cell wall biosynthesis
MKIAIIGTRGYPYVYSGYETFAKELSERLVALNHHVVIYCHRSLFKERPQFHKGIQLVYIPCLETKTMSQLSHSLLSMIHVCWSRGADIILVVNSANGPFGIIPKLFNIPTAINVDGLEWMRPKWAGLGSKYFKWSSWLSTKWYDYVITDAEEMRKVYLKEFSKDSIVIAYGANIVESNNSDRLTRFDVDPKKYFLVVGRLIPDNNFDLIVRAFEKVQTDYKLIIVGDIPYQDAYAEKVRSTEDSRIIFPGYVTDQDELTALYANCYAYIHGHEFGGTNPTLLKALASGCCIAALDTVFSREVLSNGEYGLFFNKNTVDLKELFDFILANVDQCDVYRRKSRTRIRERYTWERIVQQYTELFQQMVHEKSAL